VTGVSGSAGQIAGLLSANRVIRMPVPMSETPDRHTVAASRIA